jgi:hypothetical protein
LIDLLADVVAPVAVITTGKDPSGEKPVVLIVRVKLVEAGLGENSAVTPVGRELIESVTGSVALCSV